MTEPTQPHQLKRTVGIPGAVLLGLGSMVGTGVFVSIGIGHDLVGGWVMLAVLIAGGLALCNALSSAQLAAAYPVAGGTYEYGYRLLTPMLGFTAGITFLIAKSASAATAALAVGTLITSLRPAQDDAEVLAIGLALFAIAVLTTAVLLGLRRSNQVNGVLVALAVGSLLILSVMVMLRSGTSSPNAYVSTSTPATLTRFNSLSFLEAIALMFVAYTGYGRVATLGEEIREPKRSIPIAVVVTLIVTALLYGMIAGVISLTASASSNSTTSEMRLLDLATAHSSGLTWVFIIGAIAAMLGVLLNLILGLSRVVLAMGRRGDAPSGFSQLNANQTTPTMAVLAVTMFIGILVLGLHSLKAAWSLSAFAVLIYYGLTNLACLRLPVADRRYPSVFAYLGLFGCLGLAWFVDFYQIATGLSLLLVALILRTVLQRPVITQK